MSNDERPQVIIEANTANSVRITVEGFEILCTKYTNQPSELVVCADGKYVEVRG